jgi:hypothetical protein
MLTHSIMAVWGAARATGLFLAFYNPTSGGSGISPPLRANAHPRSGRAELGKNVPMLYMVVERYLSGPELVYERAATRGRMLPEGLAYVSSWVVNDGGMDRCFQLMETTDPTLFEVWLERWNDLVSFEVYPVITSAEAAARNAPRPPDRPAAG